MHSWLGQDRTLAFTIAEQGRILLERSESGGSEVREHVRRAHNGFGLAGYVLSDELDPETRQALTALCREHGPILPVPARNDVEAAYLLAIHGVVSVARCSGYSWPHLATRALRAAGEELAGVIGALRSDALRIEGLPRETDADWQRRHLAPLPSPVALLTGP